jgi:hypothetical protein
VLVERDAEPADGQALRAAARWRRRRELDVDDRAVA